MKEHTLFKKIFLTFIYFWERDTHTQSMSRGGAEREGDPEFEVVKEHTLKHRCTMKI